MQQLRPFIERAREVFDTRYPLAHRAPFVGGGRKLLLDLADEVYRLRPGGPESPVVNDPQLSAGSATVRGIRTEILAEQATAGATIREIAEDFGLSVGEVTAALNHELAQTA